MLRIFTTLLCIFYLSGNAWAQLAIVVQDSADRKPVPFATVKYGNTGKGTIADLEGRAGIDAGQITGVKWIEISSTGYSARRVALPLSTGKVLLSRRNNDLGEVVIKPPYDKIRRILNTTIAHKADNNPDKYNWYRCKVYYKMIADLSMPDSVLAKDTGKDGREFREFIKQQHLLMSETYSIRTWKQPQQLQEEVIGSRFSGLRRSMFTGLVTDVLPFHAYTDYINLNGKDYHNPVSKGYEQYYKFDLVDELLQGSDTVWVLGFKPRGLNANQLKGTVYINSNGYAISHIAGAAIDTALKRTVRIEQEYQLVHADGMSRWFPSHLNYIIEWEQKGKTSTFTWFLKGNSRIDSVRFREDEAFKFDKRHTVRLQEHADELADSTWKQMRPEALDKRENRTYEVIDSFGEAKHLDKAMDYMAHLPQGRVSIGKVDVDLKRIFSSNRYENVRLGLGLQTNERLIKWLSVGGWAGYGFSDAHWKYGAFAEVYADKNREFSFRLGYADDINDPGRIHLNSDLDKNYLNSYLLYRVDRIRSWNADIKKKMGYWSLDLGARQQEIIPMYGYVFHYKDQDHASYTAQEVSLGWRYAFAERTAPFFGSYYSMGTKYPVWYGKITAGKLLAGDNEIPYLQAVTAIAWQKHINRLGNERVLVSAGKLWSDDMLPLSKLFAGAGYRYDPKGGFDYSIYSFGGLITMYPYGYYTDQYVSLCLRHDFDRRLYRLVIPQTSFSSSPYIGLQYNLLYGTLGGNMAAHRNVQFSVPDNGYNEVGALLNNMLLIKYLNIYYFTLNAGYFYHVTPGQGDAKNNGKLVFGLNVEF